MFQSFEEKQKYHVTKVWKKSNSVISNVFQEEFCTNFYEMTMNATFVIVLQSFEEKQKYHVTVRVGLRNSAAVFETIASAKRCRANDIHVL